jgi:hypothetical protein
MSITRKGGGKKKGKEQNLASYFSNKTPQGMLDTTCESVQGKARYIVQNQVNQILIMIHIYITNS